MTRDAGGGGDGAGAKTKRNARKIISEVQNTAVNAGEQTLNFDASSYSNGVYYVTISTEESTVTRKFVKK